MRRNREEWQAGQPWTHHDDDNDDNAAFVDNVILLLFIFSHQIQRRLEENPLAGRTGQPDQVLFGLKDHRPFFITFKSL